MSERIRASIGAPAAWRGAEMASSGRWRHVLDEAAVTQIDEALAATAHLAPERLEPADFPLPGLDDVLQAVERELAAGSGIARIEGLPVERYAPAQLQTIFFGIGAHLGTPIPQNGARGYLREIRDRSSTGGRRVDSADALGWHNDRADRVGLLCVRQAARGGVSKLASAAAIHDEMHVRCPDLLDVLFEDFERFAPGDEVGNGHGRFATPVFRLRDTGLTTHYSRTYIEQAAALADSEPLTARQVQALDTLVAVAEEVCFEMPLSPGDMQFLNNHVVLHARSAFADDPQSGRDRLLYRLWLSSAGGAAWRG